MTDDGQRQVTHRIEKVLHSTLKKAYKAYKPYTHLFDIPNALINIIYCIIIIIIIINIVIDNLQF